MDLGFAGSLACRAWWSGQNPVLQGCAFTGINSGGNKTKQKFLLVLVGFCAAPGTERWAACCTGVASQWAAGGGILG
jgi:hypothetical protein